MPIRYSVAAMALTAAASACHAQSVQESRHREVQAGMHMYEAAKADPELARGFAQAAKPVIGAAPWVSNYGTTSPAEREEIDGRSYLVFHGCKPHDCITESYTILYDPAGRRIHGGAFVRSEYDGAILTGSRITWLGKTEFESASVIGKYLY